MFRRRLCLFAIVATAATSSCTGRVPPASQSSSVALVGVNVIDITVGHVISNATVTLTGDTIMSVSTGGPAPGARVVEGHGGYLIPGLWDMHAHTPRMWLPLYVAHGVTAIRDMGNDLDEILRLREATASGELLGPRIFAAGPILDDPPGDWPLRMRVTNADGGRAAVQLLKRRGVDLIKVHNFTPRDAFFAIADEAQRQGLRLAGHVPLKVTIEEAIEAGLTSIEHFSESGRVWKTCSGSSSYRPDACRPFFAMLADRGIWQTPTISTMAEIGTIGTPASKVDPAQLTYAPKSVKDFWAANQSMFATPEVVRSLRATAVVSATATNHMVESGVGILAGCDALIAGFCVADELQAMVRGGMSPLSALQTATINPARYFDLDQHVGSVASGRRADLVLLDANPLTDIGNLRGVRAVILRGEVLDRSALDSLLAQVRAAAAGTPSLEIGLGTSLK